MAPLRLDPSSLPDKEILILKPQMRGISGDIELSCRKTDIDLYLGARARLGLLLFKNALHVEAQSHWQSAGGEWVFQRATETNHKTGKVKVSGKGPDILALIYAMRSAPTLAVGEGWVGAAHRGDALLEVEIFAKERRERVIKAFGSTPRGLLRIEIVIEKAGKKTAVFDEGGAKLWIDQQSKLPVEISYQIPAIGALTVTLEQIQS